MVNENGSERFRAAKVERIVDTTAAGDCFNAAFVVSLAEGKEPKEAILYATAAASVSVTRFGAQSSIPDKEETDRAYEMLKQGLI